MRGHHKHIHLARRKMGHIIDEIYTALFHCGSEEVDLKISKESDGLRLLVKGDFNREYADDIKRMGELLQPPVRSAAMVEEYWELAGEDRYSSESEMALVGQMADDAALTVDGKCVEIEIFVAY